MNNEEYIAMIMQMDVAQLLDHVLAEPTELTDPYYREFGRAIRARHDELKQQTPTERKHP